MKRDGSVFQGYCDAVLEAAKRPEGFVMTDLVPSQINTTSSFSRAVRKAEEAGLVFRAAWASNGVRYFGDKDAAERFLRYQRTHVLATGPVMLRIEEMAKSPKGFKATDVEGRPARVSSVLQRFIDSGRLFRVKLSHRRVMYFGRKEWAEAAEKALAEHGLRRQVPKRQQSMTVAVPSGRILRGRAPWKDSDPAIYPTDKQGRPLYKVTVAPPLPDRPLRTNTHSIS